MKSLAFLVVALVACAVKSQLASAPLASEGSLEAQSIKRVPEGVTLFKEQKPNEIVAGNLTYSGILVEAAKVDNPLDLLKQTAPREFGPAEDNVARDPINGKISGLKVFSIQF